MWVTLPSYVDANSMLAEALDHGTLFRELDKPLTGVCVDGGGDCA